MSFASAHIGSELGFDAAAIYGDIGLRQLRATALRTDSGTQIEGIMDLRHAAARVLRDAEGYHSQPYEHLAAVYRSPANDAGARAILYARQPARRHTLSVPLQAWDTLQDWIVGCGYPPAQRPGLPAAMARSVLRVPVHT
jgi:hypothetical protein